MTYGWHDLPGIIGVVLILATPMLLQLEKLSATSFLYSATNGLGAISRATNPDSRLSRTTKLLSRIRERLVQNEDANIVL